MTWQVVTLTNDDIVAYKHGKLQDAFETVMMATRAPRDAAMFTHSEASGPYHYYFSPGAAAIFGVTLALWNASPCAAPDRTNMCLLVGHTDTAWDMLADRTSDET